MMRLSLSLSVLVTNEVMLRESEEELFSDHKCLASNPKHSFHFSGEQHRSHHFFGLGFDPYQARMREVSNIPLSTQVVLSCPGVNSDSCHNIFLKFCGCFREMGVIASSPVHAHSLWTVGPPSSTGGIAKYCMMAALEQLLSSAELPD